MTTVPPEAPVTGPTPDPSGPRVTGPEMRDVSRLRRTVLAERKLAGVAGGLARHFDIDPLIVRVAFVVLTLFGGAGVLLYGALWLLLPEDGADTAPVRLDERSLTVALVGVAAIAAFIALGAWSGTGWVSWPLAVALLIVLLYYSARDRRPAAPAERYPGPAFYAPQSAPYAGPAAPSAPATGTPTVSTPSATGWVPAGASLPPTPPMPPTPPGGPAWSGPVGPAPLPPRPRDPRKHGPILFWFTLALVTLGLGVLGMVDVAGAAIPVAAYPALATGLVGLMLLVGAFYGRAGGLIALGLLTATVLAGTAVGEHVESQRSLIRPTSSTQVSGTYTQAAGELVLDLSAVTNPEALDGRTISVEQGAGRLEVVVPDDVDVITTVSVGAGDVQVFGETRDGLGIDTTTRHDAPGERATFTLDVQMGFGEIDIHTATDAD